MSDKTAIADVIRAQATGLGNMEALLIQQSTELARAKAELLKQAKAIEDLEDEPLPPPPPDGDDLFLAIPERLWTIDHRSKVELDDRGGAMDVVAIYDPYTGERVASAPGAHLPSKIPETLPRLDEDPFRLRGYGGWLEGPSADGLRTLVVVALSTAQPGRFAKLVGADAETSERGGLCLGRTKGGEIEAWADDGVQFAAARAPLAEGRPVLYVVRLEENRLRLYCDGHERTVEYAEALAPLTGPLVFLAGWWQHEVVDPANALLYAAHGFGEAISDEDLAKVVEHYRELAPPKPKEPGNGSGGGNGPPPGPHPDDVPPAPGPTIDVNVGNASERTANAPADANLIFAKGNYKLANLRARHGQVWRAPDGATIDGGGARFLVNASGSHFAKGVAFVGFTVTNFDASPKGLNSKRRMNDETGVFQLEVDKSTDWTFAHMNFRKLGKGAIWGLSGRNLLSDILCEDVEGVAIGGPMWKTLIRRYTARRINQKVRAHTHHHSGCIKCIGGLRHLHGGPPREGVVIDGLDAEDVYGRCVWFDWDQFDMEIRRFNIRRPDKEGIVIEASKGARIHDGSISGRRSRHKDPAEWNALINFQNGWEGFVEGVELFASPATDAAVSVSHHQRHNMTGPTLGRFVGMNNTFRDSRVQHGIEHVLYQGVVDILPGRQAVLASNTVSGITRF